MKELQIFNNPQFGEIRISLNEANEPMFCLSDVCGALNLTNPSKVKTSLKLNGVTTGEVIDSMGRTQIATFISEANLYKCIFQSRKQEAEKFQDWICEEVLPTIRKTGSYSVGQFQTPKTFADALLLAYNQQKQIEQQQATIQMQTPKVEYYDTVLQSDGTMTTTQVAKTLGRSAKWLHQQLKKCGLLYYQSGQWLVKSPYDRCGLHKVRTSTYPKSDGSIASKSSTVWTEKGKRFISALFDCGFKLSSAVAIMRQEKGAVAV